VSAFRQVELNPLLFEFHQTARVHFARRGCLLAYWLAYALHHVPQIGKVYVVFALIDFDDITLMQGRKMIRLLAIADAPSHVDLSCMRAYVGLLHMKDVVQVDS
jgi:hypothetical protein